MNISLFGLNISRRGMTAIAVGGLVFLFGSVANDAFAAEVPNEFSKPTIDIGVVVKDAARTARFLTEGIGFKEVKGFSVTAEMGKRIGLIEGHAVDVRVFVLEDIDRATRIKVLSFPAARSVQPDQTTIHATLGMRYLTLFVKDMNRAMERLKKLGVPLLGESPVDLGGGSYLTVVKDPDGNFVELIGPLK